MATKNKNVVTKNSGAFRLKLPAKTENLGIIRQFIAGIADNVGFSDDDIYQIELAVDEACANVVKHAYMNTSATKNEMLVTVHVKPDRLEITIADRGKGFNPDHLHSPDMDEYLKRMKPGGLGVHLIKTLMDKVTFNIKPGVRNEVRMVKNRSKG